MKNLLVIVLLLTLSATTFAEKPSEVTVINTPSVDVLALPDVNVATLPAVDVNSLPAVDVNSLPAVDVNSLPDVNVATLPDVYVSNMPTPVERELFILSITKECGGCYSNDYIVPEGKTLVIENINVQAYINAEIINDQVQMFVLDPQDLPTGVGTPRTHFYHFTVEAVGRTRQFLTSATEWVDIYKALGHEAGPFYAEAGHGLTFIAPSVTGLANDGDAWTRFELTGYLIPSNN